MTTSTTIDTDLVTPLQAYLHLRLQGRASFLLESVDQGRLGRYSFVGCGSRLVPLHEAEALDAPVVGYLAYDHIATARTDRAAARRRPGRSRRAGSSSPTSSCASTTSPAPPRCSTATPTTVAALLARPVEAARRDGFRAAARRCASRAAPSTSAASSWPRSTSAAATRSRSCSRSGPSAPTTASPLAVYRALRRINPSPYLFLLELDGFALVGSSPETHVKAEGRRASLNPIAGTTARGEGDAERLLTSEKDRAEHVMLVDLGRNDLSRVCVPGTVRVERFLQPERFSHVTHLVSEVAGELREGVSPFDLLRATFPAGTVSGAPKVRAMQIISELEGYRRGTYAGVVGYNLPGVALDTCIAIRTVLLRDGRAYLQAGGGIVVDSDPAAEHQECLNKLAALEAAIDLAEAR